MAKTSLSELQQNRVNELAFNIWNMILAIKPAKNELPEFLSNMEGKGEYAVKNAIALALRAIYIPDCQYVGNFEALWDFLIVRHECHRQRLLANPNMLDAKLCAGLCAAVYRIGEMESEKLVHAPKQKQN